MIGKAISGLVKVTYCSAPTVLLYKEISKKWSLSVFVRKTLKAIGVDHGVQSSSPVLPSKSATYLDLERWRPD